MNKRLEMRCGMFGKGAQKLGLKNFPISRVCTDGLVAVSQEVKPQAFDPAPGPAHL